MNFCKLKATARGLVILGAVSGLRAFGDWPMQGHDPAQTNCQTESAGCMDIAPYLKWFWTHPFGARCSHQPIVGDVDGDGKGEILVFFNELGLPGDPIDTFLYCFNGEDGSILWKYRLRAKNEQTFGLLDPPRPCLGDLDNDGLKKAVFTRGYSPWLVALNGDDTTVLWEKDFAAFQILVVDVERDGQPEVLFITFFPDTALYLLEGSTGNTRWSVQTAPGAISAGDMDGDGDEDIVLVDIDGIGPPYLYISTFTMGRQVSFSFPRGCGESEGGKLSVPR